MAIVDLVMPKLGESIMEATILKWHKQPGDTVKMDETVLEIATDKVDSEVPSTAEGVIEEILFNVNDVVPDRYRDRKNKNRCRRNCFIKTCTCTTKPVETRQHADGNSCS